MIHSFGRADKLDHAALERLVHSIRRVLGEQPAGDDAGRPLEIEAVYDLGLVHVVAGLWDQLGIGAVLGEQIREKKLKAPHEAALFAMVAQRLERPGSKLACHERWLERVWLPAAQDLRLFQLYRALDLLAARGAAELLSAADLPIKRIASLVGYHSRSSFSHRFEAHFGISPDQFRRRMRQDEG